MKSIIFLFVILSVNINIFSQNTISGTVSDDLGPLPGVNVLIQGTSNGTKTDFDGKYTINTTKGTILVFTYIGYKTLKKTVGNHANINVRMLPIQTVLEECVVTAYGVKIHNRKRKKRRVGNVGASSRVVIRGLSDLNRGDLTDSETYKEINENVFKSAVNQPLSTFSIDVDKASYSNIRRMINNGQTIPEDAVKIEEMINYFEYNYTQPVDEHPFAIHTQLAGCPWNEKHQLLQIDLQGKIINNEDLPPANLVFLIDVSGSMDSPNKLSLLVNVFKVLVKNLRKKDKVSIVVYAGAAGVVLKPTSGANQQKIVKALNQLQAGGSTAGGEGLQLAYKLAKTNFKKKGNNRVILATDGDFNIGESSVSGMKKLIKEKRKTGIFLTVLGFGMGNYRDSMLEILADKGNGNYAYIDTMQEAQRFLGKEFGGTMYTIAKDVKIQVEFNPEQVAAYRLIGYENRLLKNEDFKDDTIDAGEIGSGHSVTAFYEIIPKGVQSDFIGELPKLKYKKPSENNNYSKELATIKFRYKKPKGNESIVLQKIVKSKSISFDKATDNFRFSSAVAMLGMLLRHSKFKGSSSYNKIILIADQSLGRDEDGYRKEFIRLVKTLY